MLNKVVLALEQMVISAQRWPPEGTGPEVAQALEQMAAVAVTAPVEETARTKWALQQVQRAIETGVWQRQWRVDGDRGQRQTLRIWTCVKCNRTNISCRYDAYCSGCGEATTTSSVF